MTKLNHHLLIKLYCHVRYRCFLFWVNKKIRDYITFEGSWYRATTLYSGCSEHKTFIQDKPPVYVAPCS